ncbi:MAG: hypothetical protein QGG97_02485 [Flavobacteriales bacterium]|jgi:hypothetical protein|nr:hypothetical protein [Flavobacteriales bacterium]|tara:strand:+ start:53 stop:523 length:471 start_codon:yes stop_codon:yes gene_type:complete
MNPTKLKNKKWKNLLFCILFLFCVLLTSNIGLSNSEVKEEKENLVDEDDNFPYCSTIEEVEEIVKLFNDYTVSKRLGFTFECDNPESDRPMLRCYTSFSWLHCLEDEYKLKWVLRAMSMDWNIYTGSKEVGMYDDRRFLVFRIDKDGNFNIIGQTL